MCNMGTDMKNREQRNVQYRTVWEIWNRRICDCRQVVTCGTVRLEEFAVCRFGRNSHQGEFASWDRKQGRFFFNTGQVGSPWKHEIFFSTRDRLGHSGNGTFCTDSDVMEPGHMLPFQWA